MKTVEESVTNQPFSVTLKPFLVEFFHCNDESSPWFTRSQGSLIDPSFENATKATFTNHTIKPEAPRC